MSEWADKYRKLSPESSSEPGQWRTDRAPYLRGIMDAISDASIQQVCFMKSAQTGGTEVLNNIVGYFIDQDPAPMLLVQPTLDMGKAWSKDRLAPMLRDTPRLDGKVKDARSRDADNTVLHKRFPGGHITIAGANSAASLASRPIRVTLFDEVDRYPVSAGTEGDPVNLGRKRSTTFWNRKSVEISTPTVKDASRIESSYNASTMDEYYVPCPHCGEFQTLKWGGPDEPYGIKWDRDEEHRPETAHYVCEHHGCVITDLEKAGMLAGGEWRSRYPRKHVRGFHINELYSPWVTFEEMVRNFLEAKGSPDTLKTWVNTALGETFDETEKAVESGSLYARREHYRAEVPAGVQIITAYADVQDDRLEVEFCGWGAGEESWSLDYIRLYGDPGRLELWNKLHQQLSRQFLNEDGVMVGVKLCGIDSQGHYTDEVNNFCNKYGQGRWVIPTKGHSQRNQPIATYPRKRNKKNVYLTMIGTDTAKELVYSRYEISEPGPGYCHYPVAEAYDEVYFKQATAERKQRHFSHGVPYFSWEAGGRRNEALDCRVGNLALIRILQQHRGVRLTEASRPVSVGVIKTMQKPVARIQSNSFERKGL